MREFRCRFSIIIPTYQRPRQLTECLRSLGMLEYAADQFEVIVVDDGSREPPREIVEAFSNRIRVRLIASSHGGPGLARNIGASSAEGRYLVFTDDDCRLAPDYLRLIDARLVSQPDIGVGGRTENILTRDIFAEATQQLIDHLYAHFNELTAPRFFPTTSLVVSRDQFCAIGGFDVSFPQAGGEDRDFCERWVAAGFQFVYAPEAVVGHSHALDLRAFLGQHFNYGRGRYYLLRARRLRGERHVPSLEPAGFYTDLLRRPLRNGVHAHSARLTLLLALTQFAYAMGYARERIRPHHELPRSSGTPLVSPNGAGRPSFTDRPGVIRRADEVEGREVPQYPDSIRRAPDAPSPSVMQGPPSGR